MNVNLTPHFEHFVQAQLAGGQYSSVSEIVRDALRLLEENKRLQELKLRHLRVALDEGECSPDAPYDIEALIAEGKKRRSAKVNKPRGRHA